MIHLMLMFIANEDDEGNSSPPSMIHLENSQKVGLCRLLPSTAIGAPAFFLQEKYRFGGKEKEICSMFSLDKRS